MSKLYSPPPARFLGLAGSKTAPPPPISKTPRSAFSARSHSRSRRSKHNGIKVNLLDAPGYADFTGDLRAGLRAADAALFAVSAIDGIDGVTRMLWEECAAVGMPRAVVITKIDHQRADFETTLDACREAFGDAVAPLYLPVGEPVTGLLGLLSQKLYSYAAASAPRALRRPRTRIAWPSCAAS